MSEDQPSADTPQNALVPYTLGQLVRDLEGSERAYQANLRTAQKKEVESPAEAIWWHAQASALRFMPDPARMPGIDRLEALCDEEWGNGLTAENIRKLRGRLCSKLGIGITEADAVTLELSPTLWHPGQEAKRKRKSRPRLRSSSQLHLNHRLRLIPIGPPGTTVRIGPSKIMIPSRTTLTSSLW